MMQPPPNMIPMQHRMPNQFGSPIATQFGATPFGMPPPGFQPFGGYGPPQTNWGNVKSTNEKKISNGYDEKKNFIVHID